MARLTVVFAAFAAAVIFAVAFRYYTPKPDTSRLRDVCLYDNRVSSEKPLLCRCSVDLRVSGESVTLIFASGRRERYRGVFPVVSPRSQTCAAWGP
ncbi:hypothetical protein [Oceanithermus sp.]|uniref:hypothetical protein n=1 Tax=Oceanithermus sp. TaxID=2268145 RepID=UPI00257C3E1A|nr:hypothetical protein [Oceanithermus sp.]